MDRQEDIQEQFNKDTAHLTDADLSQAALSLLRALAVRHGHSFESEIAALHDGVFVHTHNDGDPEVIEGYAAAFHLLRNNIFRDNKADLKQMGRLRMHKRLEQESDLVH